MIAKPRMESKVGNYRFTFDDLGIMVDVEHLDDDAKGELLIWYKNGAATPSLLHQAQHNLLSTTLHQQVERGLKTRLEDVDWSIILTYVTHMALDDFRRGEPLLELSTDDEARPIEYMAKPLIVKGMPNILFGDGGAGKSETALLSAMFLFLGMTDNPMNLEVSELSQPGIILDFEADEFAVRRRMRRIKDGLGLPTTFVKYRRCVRPLCEDLPEIKRLTDLTKAKWIVIDSLAPACGDDLFAPGTANKFFRALRQLKTSDTNEPITSIIVAHNSKGGEDSPKTVFGSVFFTNLARSVWELRGEQEGSENHIGMFHRKANETMKHPPMGFKLTYNDPEGPITIEPEDLKETRHSSQLPASILIKDYLRRGKASVSELHESLMLTENNIRVTLKRLKDKGVAVQLGKDVWGLMSQ